MMNKSDLAFKMVCVAALVAIAWIACMYAFPEIALDKHNMALQFMADIGTSKNEMIRTIGTSIKAFGSLMML